MRGKGSATSLRSLVIIGSCLVVLWVVAVFASSDDSVLLRTPAATFIHLEVAKSTVAQERGLSGRPSLAPDRGMLFQFSSDKVQCFWMKDMRFSLDIIWLDKNKRVVTIAARVSPQTYPKNFCSDEPVRYVIELNTGEAERVGIVEGKTLTF